MGHIIGRGRKASETYPSTDRSGGAVAPDLPLSGLAFVDYGTTTPLADQNGFIGTPFATVQQALGAGFTSIYINGSGAEDVVAPGFVMLTGMDANVALNSLTLPDGAGAKLSKVAIATLTAGDGCNVTTDRDIAASVFGTGGFFITNGPGFLGFSGSLADQLSLGDITMGAGASLNASNTVFPVGAVVAIDGNIQMFGSTSRCSMTAVGFDAQSSFLSAGTYTTSADVKLQDVETAAGVAFNNALGQAFNLDGFSNYWIKTNAVALTNPGQKVITDDLIP